MYRQREMDIEHRPLQLILWRYSPNESLSMYQLNTVTYVTKAAPQLGIKCVQQLAKISFENLL